MVNSNVKKETDSIVKSELNDNFENSIVKKENNIEVKKKICEDILFGVFGPEVREMSDIEFKKLLSRAFQ